MKKKRTIKGRPFLDEISWYLLTFFSFSRIIEYLLFYKQKYDNWRTRRNTQWSSKSLSQSPFGKSLQWRLYAWCISFSTFWKKKYLTSRLWSSKWIEYRNKFPCKNRNSVCKTFECPCIWSKSWNEYCKNCFPLETFR